MSQPDHPNPPNQPAPTIVTIPVNNSLSTAGLLLSLAFAMGIGIFIGSQDSVRTKLPWAKSEAETPPPSVPVISPQAQMPPVAVATPPPPSPGAWMNKQNVGNSLDRGAYNKTQSSGSTRAQ